MGGLGHDRREKVDEKTLIFLISVVLLSFVFQACGEKPNGVIGIHSVTPNSGLVDNNFYDFDVEVEYELYNTSQGELHVRFKTPNVAVYSMVESETIVIN